MKIKTLLVDDHPLILLGIRAALTETDDIEVVGEAHNGSEALPLVNQLQPDVVLLDIEMPKMNGIVCLGLLRKRHPDIKVVMFSMHDDLGHVQAALKRGASGYIVKSIDSFDLPSVLRQIVEGTVYSFLGTSEGTRQEAREIGLTKREITILAGAARGLSNQAIGKELWVTEQTVKFHLTNIYRKLGVANRTEAAHMAYRLGIVVL